MRQEMATLFNDLMKLALMNNMAKVKVGPPAVSRLNASLQRTMVSWGVIQKNFFWAMVVRRSVITTVNKHSLKAAGDLHRIYIYQ